MSRDDPLFVVKYMASVTRGLRRALELLAIKGGPVVYHAGYPFQARALASMGLPYVFTFAAPVYKEVVPEHQNRYWMPSAVASVATHRVKRVEKVALAKAARVATLSDFTRREVEELVGRSLASPVEVIPGGIDTDFFCPAGPDWTDPAPPARPLLFTARRHVVRTGVENLVRAMPNVRRALPRVRLVIAGDGPRRPAIEALVKDLNLTGCVDLIGRVSDEEVRDWYRRADIAVTPTFELEGFGLSTAEAMACGTAPLVTPVGANPELVRDLPGEHLARGTDASSIGKAIVALAERLDAVGGEGDRYRSVAQAWSWDRVIPQYLRIYEDVLEATE